MKSYSKTVFVGATQAGFSFPDPLPSNVRVGTSNDKPDGTKGYRITGEAFEAEPTDEWHDINEMCHRELGMSALDVLNGQGLPLEFGDKLKKPFVERKGRASTAKTIADTFEAMKWAMANRPELISNGDPEALLREYRATQD